MLLLCAMVTAFAQATVTGRVVEVDTNEPIPGVNVLVRGTSTGTVTGMNGEYSIAVPENAVLIFSFVGFETESIEVGSRSIIDVVMSYDISTLQEVVVVGYGSQDKRDLTSSISQIDAEQLDLVPAVSVDNIMQGLASGVQVSTANGVPGAPTRVMIRGTNSISSGTEPLWVIDGMILSQSGELDGLSRNEATVPQNPLSLINPNDIESIEVLKDAAATSIYGSRGANGVILVTTKKGKEGVKSFNIDFQQGVTDVVRGPEEIGFVDGDTWLALGDQARANNGLAPYDLNSALNSGRDPNAVLDRSQAENTNWFDEVLRNGAFTDLNVSAANGTENASYYISGQYRRDKSVLQNNDLERVSLRTNLDFKAVDNLDIGLRATVSYSKNERAANGGGPDGNSFMARGGYDQVNTDTYPWLPILHPTVRDENGNQVLFDPLSGNNVLATLNRDNYINDLESYRAIGGLFLEYYLPFIKGLSVRSEAAYDFFHTSNIEWGNTVIREGSSYAFDNSNTFRRMNYNLYTSYNRSIGANHHLNVVMGVEQTSQQQRERNLEADELNGTLKEVGQPGNVLRVTGRLRGEIYFRGFFARANYRLFDRYLLGLSLRRDGSSIFTSDNRWGTFPAVSAGWIISDESFMDGLPVLNFLKLRASYGLTGNANISPRATVTSYDTWGQYGDVGAGDLLRTIANEDVTWETTNAMDVALDFELLENRISGSVGYYHQNVTDMLFRVPVPVSSGIFDNNPTIWDNIGDMKNYGFEVSLNATVINSGDLKWDVGFNFTTNKNEVTRLKDDDDELYDRNANGLVTRVGQPLAFFRLARYAGIHPEGGYELIEEMDLERFDETGERVATGNLIPASRANLQEHLFDDTDKTSLPTWFGGFNTSATYKNIDVSLFFAFQGGNYIFDEAEYESTFIGAPVLRSDLVNNTWTPENPNAEYPRLVWDRLFDVIEEGGSISEDVRFDPRRDGQRHDKFLHKGDFLRLRTLSVGYSLPQNILEKLHVRRLRVFVMANNLFTITGYDGYDPEAVDTSGDSQERNISQGWLGVQLPQVRTYSAGINLGF